MKIDRKEKKMENLDLLVVLFGGGAFPVLKEFKLVEENGGKGNGDWVRRRRLLPWDLELRWLGIEAGAWTLKASAVPSPFFFFIFFLLLCISNSPTCYNDRSDAVSWRDRWLGLIFRREKYKWRLFYGSGMNFSGCSRLVGYKSGRLKPRLTNRSTKTKVDHNFWV